MIGGSEKKRHATTASTAAARRIRIGASSLAAMGKALEFIGYTSPMIPKDATGSALEVAREVLKIEAAAVRALIRRIDERFLAAVSLILGCKKEGRGVVT